METKLVEKKAEEETAQYDETGKMMLPYKENGKTTLKTQEQMKSILDKKDKKQKVNKKAIQNKKQSKKVKQKKVADASYRMKFVDRVVKNNTEIDSVEKDDRIVLKYKKFQVCRIMVRVNSRMCVYRKTEAGARDTIRIKTEADEDALYDWVQKRVEFLKAKAPKPKK